MSFLGDIASSLSGLLGLKGDACPTHLPPLIQWPGGKARMAKRLNKMFPKHDTYVEPFAGGASLFFYKPLVKKNVLSDMDPWLIDLYKDVKAGKLSQCEGGIKPSRSLFARAQKNKSACHKVAVVGMSYHGNRKSYFLNKGRDGRAFYQGKLGKQRCYAAKLAKATVKKGDFASVSRANDSKHTLHFWDPPWPIDYSDMYYGNTKPGRGKSKNKKAFGGSMDPRYVRKVADSLKGTVVVIYNWTPELQRTFSGPRWKTMKISAPTHLAKSGNVMRPNLVAIKKAA